MKKSNSRIQNFKAFLKVSLLFCGIFAQISETKGQISATVTGGACAGTYSFTANSTFNGRHQYTGSILGLSANLNWSGTRWEISSAFTGVVFYNTTDVSPDPPCYNVGTWVSTGSCAGGSFTNSSGSCTIPIELVSFDVKNSGKANELFWKTASEVDNKGFKIDAAPERRGRLHETGAAHQVHMVQSHQLLTSASVPG